MFQILEGYNNRTTVVLHGLGGIGKTQLAVEYINRHKGRHTAIFWFNANDENSLKSSFRDVAQQILDEHESNPTTKALNTVDLDGNLDQVVAAVKAWLKLRGNTQWLVVYDNYDNPQIPGNLDDSSMDIRSFLPRCDPGSVIITTRSAQVTLGHRIHVQKLPNINESLAILETPRDGRALRMVGHVKDRDKLQPG